MHKLILVHVHRNMLKKLGCLIWAAVRRWLQLPIKDGGLRVSCFSTLIQLLQGTRLEKIVSHPTTLFQTLQRQDVFGP